MLSYIRRAQRRRMYERANSSDNGQFAIKEPESPSNSSANSATANGQNSEGFHFYSSVKKQRSLPDIGRVDLGEKESRSDKRLSETLSGMKSNQEKKATNSE